jgi:hypothetical protein
MFLHLYSTCLAKTEACYFFLAQHIMYKQVTDTGVLLGCRRLTN